MGPTETSPSLVIRAFELENQWRFAEALSLYLQVLKPLDVCEELDDIKIRIAGARCAIAARQPETALNMLPAVLADVGKDILAAYVALRARALIETNQAEDAAALLRRHIYDNNSQDANSPSSSAQVKQGSTVEVLRLLLVDALARLHPRVAVISRAAELGGRVLVARTDMPTGTIALQEQPLAIWSTRSKSSSAAASDSAVASPEVPSPNFVRAFVKLTPDAQAAVIDLCCLPQSPRDAVALVAAVRRFKAHYSADPDIASADLSLKTLCALALIERLNAHSSLLPNGTASDADAHTVVVTTPAEASAVFDVMSKASHSCAPNCVYDASRKAYVALTAIRREDEIGFPYFGRHLLARPATERTRVLHQSHQVDVCQCQRCCRDRVDGDPCRSIRCPTAGCKGFRLRRDVPSFAESRDHAAAADKGITTTFRADGFEVASPSSSGWGGSSALWHCDACRDTWTDGELPLAKEAELCAAVADLWQSRNAPIAKTQYERAKDLLQRVSDSLGRRHWAYLHLVEVLASFFFAVANKSSARTAVVARTCAASFVHKYLRTATDMKLIDHAPLLCAEMALGAARRLSTTPELRVDVVVLTVTALALADIDAVFPNGADVAWLREQSVESALFAPHLERFRRGESLRQPSLAGIATQVDRAAVWRAIAGGEAVWRRAEEDDSDTLAAWEDHLTERVLAEMKGSQAPNVPASVQAALRSGRA